MEEAELIGELKRASDAAYAELLRLHARSVINTCYRILLNQQDAEDVAQEVFIEVLQSIGSFRGDSKLSTWLYRIAVSRSLDELKKRKRAKRFAAFARFLSVDDLSDTLQGGPTADVTIREAERMRALQKLLDTLPDNQRVAFSLSKMEGFTSQEIAEIMKTTTVAVDSLIYRAKQRLSDELRNILSDDS